jgi:hypothetical protein
MIRPHIAKRKILRYDFVLWGDVFYTKIGFRVFCACFHAGFRTETIRSVKPTGWCHASEGGAWRLRAETEIGYFLEAATGLEPVNNGFADRCLSHLAMPPFWRGLKKIGAGNGI